MSSSLRAGALPKSRLPVRHHELAQGRRVRVVFSRPYWWNDPVSAIDALERLGIEAGDPEIAAGLRWFAGNRREDGLWELTSISGRVAGDPPSRAIRAWLGLTIARILRRYYSRRR